MPLRGPRSPSLRTLRRSNISGLLIRSPQQIDQVLTAVGANPGIVLFTVVDGVLRNRLESGCWRLWVPTVPVLEPVIAALSGYIGIEAQGQPGLQHAFGAEYFLRIDAIQFVLARDDGQLVNDLDNVDIVLVGVSRTSKTPTCFYLANRGIKAANVATVPATALPLEVERLINPLVVGLTITVERVLGVRHQRLGVLEHSEDTDYVNPERVAREVHDAQRLFSEHRWLVIDVTRRSIEEIAAAILQLLTQRLGGKVTFSTWTDLDGTALLP